MYTHSKYSCAGQITPYLLQGQEQQKCISTTQENKDVISSAPDQEDGARRPIQVSGEASHHRTRTRTFLRVRYCDKQNLELFAENLWQDESNDGGIILTDKKQELTIKNDVLEFALEEETPEEESRAGSSGECFLMKDQSGLEILVKQIPHKNWDENSEEIQNMVSLNDVEGIPRIYGAVKESNSVYILMEFINGIILDTWRGSFLDLLQIFLGLYSLADTCHRDFKIVHGDIHSLNVIIVNPHRVYLIDFGNSRKNGNNFCKDVKDITSCLRSTMEKIDIDFRRIPKSLDTLLNKAYIGKFSDSPAREMKDLMAKIVREECVQSNLHTVEDKLGLQPEDN